MDINTQSKLHTFWLVQKLKKKSIIGESQMVDFDIEERAPEEGIEAPTKEDQRTIIQALSHKHLVQVRRAVSEIGRQTNAAIDLLYDSPPRHYTIWLWQPRFDDYYNTIKQETESIRLSMNGMPMFAQSGFKLWPNGKIEYNNRPLDLNGNSYKIFSLFLRSKNSMVTYDDIKEELLSIDKSKQLDNTTIAKYVSKLGKDLEPYLGKGVFENSRGVGWRLKLG